MSALSCCHTSYPESQTSSRPPIPPPPSVMQFVREEVLYPKPVRSIAAVYAQTGTACLALLVESQSFWIEFLDDLLWRIVLLDLAIKVEADHVARVDLACQLEVLDQAL